MFFAHFNLQLTDLLHWIDDVRDLHQNNNKNISEDEEGRNNVDVTEEHSKTEESASVFSTTIGATARSIETNDVGTANVDRISGITSISGSGFKGEEHPYVPYTLSYSTVTSSSGKEERFATASYSIPENL